MDAQALETTAREMVAPNKGILAADESTGTIGKRFSAVGIESAPETRRAYRDMLFGTPGLGEHISGVILYDETIRQSALDGTPFPELLERYGMIPGIKVDTGAKPLALHPGEKVTEGLDGLRERIGEYVRMGARFAKWRASSRLGSGPRSTCGSRTTTITSRRAGSTPTDASTWWGSRGRPSSTPPATAAPIQ